jgi:two-component system response regulator PilR (NtrC family)
MSAVRILVVDDDESILEFLTMILEGAGFAVETADHGQKAVDIVAADGLSAVLLDYMMPDQNGLEVAAKLRDIHPAMPVFIVTAYDSPELRREAAKHGVCDVIGKPFQPEELVEKLRNVLQCAK